MDWIVPDGQNKKLRDHRNKSMSEGMPPDRGPAMYINLSNLGPYFSSSNFLIDMHGPISPVLLLTTHPSVYSLTDLPEGYDQ